MADLPPVNFRSRPIDISRSISRLGDYANSPVGPKFVWALVVILAIFQCIDTYTTYLGVVVNGWPELNPIMKLGFELTSDPLALMVVAKVSAIIIIVFLNRWILMQGFIKWPMRVMFFVNYIYAVGMIWNSTQLGIL